MRAAFNQIAEVPTNCKCELVYRSTELEQLVSSCHLKRFNEAFGWLIL